MKRIVFCRAGYWLVWRGDGWIPRPTWFSVGDEIVPEPGEVVRVEWLGGP